MDELNNTAPQDAGPAIAPDSDTEAFTVYLRRRGGSTRGRIVVQARSATHAERIAVAQNIAVSFPKSKPRDWIVTSVSIGGAP